MTKRGADASNLTAFLYATAKDAGDPFMTLPFGANP
jgi:hypothetical protein